ncbi:MAG: ATP-binding cassette domain-containing protein, partial [Paludibacteraceae bacterium]|nr:ATP-binding cassette domain-containing protein [Paludibacteraceae bacterium]
MAVINYIQLENVSKRFGDLLLFEGLNMDISEGQRVALIAKNGTGKSTLLNIIMGKESLDEGKITFRRDITLSFLEQDPSYNPEQTILDTFFSSNNETIRLIAQYEAYISKNENLDSPEFQELVEQMEIRKAWDYDIKIKQILAQLKITDFDKKIKHLSGGQLKRVALANALITEPDLLILDEPTNHLDLEMTEWLEEYLIRSGLTLLMVTHDRYFLDRVCTDIIEIDQKQLYAYKGNYSYYLEKRQDRIDAQNAELARANNLFRKELDWMRRQPQARATKAKSRIDSFYDLEKKVAQKRQDESVKLQMNATYLGSKIFEAKYISKQFDDFVLIKDFYYNFSRYEKMGIIGKNGTGKSTFLKLLLGIIKPDSGSFDIGETVSFGYYSQDGLTFDEQMKVIDVVRDIAEEINIGNGKKLSASQFLQHFLFTPETQHNYVYKLSGGEKRRLYLCTVLMKNPNFLVLDEPTNDLDIVTLNVLEEYLANFKGCVIVVSHDRYFTDKVVDHLLVFQGNAVIKDFPGNYSDYREWKEQQDAIDAKQAEIKQKNKVEEPKRSVNRTRKLSFAE